MKNNAQQLTARLLALLWGASAVAHASPGQSWGTFSDTWVATDALGRTLPDHAQVGAPRTNKFVAVFYFLWHGAHVQGGPYDITKILAADPAAMQKPDSPLWGPLHAPHHWGESIFGYYLTDDAGVLRKHAQMLSDAGVDAILFDVSNQVTYKPYYLALLRVFAEVKNNGGHPPQVAFLCPFWDPSRVVPELYRDLYEPGLFSDLWFRWEGKPLILADPAMLNEQEGNSPTQRLREFFTFRKPQPDYFLGPTGPNQWSWLEVYPQHVFTNALGEKEQMSVGVAQNAVSNRLATLSEPGARGRNFHRGANDTAPDAVRHGYNVTEQWERALREDPRLIFITGWNEWIAGRFNEFNGVKLPVMFVDQFNPVNSRDIEPMNGGHGDTYFYQMVAQIRRFKGARRLAAVVPRPIQIDGRFDDWPEVTPEFRDPLGDPVQRDHPGWAKAGPYVNKTGRNDLVAAKVSWDATNIYFYARTREPLTPASDPNWMLLFLDCDRNPTNGWLGYDRVVNRTGVSSRATVIEVQQGRGYQWGAGRNIPVRFARNEIELAIPWTALSGATALPATLDFKWADNLDQTGEWSDFTLNGDAAPNDRFNYRARLEP